MDNLTQKYFIRLPSVKNTSISRYFISIGLNKKYASNFYQDEFDRFVLKNSPSWVLVMLGYYCQGLEFSFEKALTANDINSESYRNMIQNISDVFPSTKINQGRPYQGDINYPPTLQHSKYTIAHYIINIWRRGLQIASSLIKNYFLYQKQGKHNLCLSLLNLIYSLNLFNQRKWFNYFNLKKVKTPPYRQKPSVELQIKNNQWFGLTSDDMDDNFSHNTKYAVKKNKSTKVSLTKTNQKHGVRSKIEQSIPIDSQPLPKTTQSSNQNQQSLEPVEPEKVENTAQNTQKKTPINNTLEDWM